MLTLVDFSIYLFLRCCVSDWCGCFEQELGPITYKEIVVLSLFVSLVALWIFQRPKFIDGWADLLEEKTVGAATPAIMVLLFVFIFPAKNPFIGFRRGKPAEYLITWDLVQKKIPWGIILLIGNYRLHELTLDFNIDETLI